MFPCLLFPPDSPLLLHPLRENHGEPTNMGGTPGTVMHLEGGSLPLSAVGRGFLLSWCGNSVCLSNGIGVTSTVGVVCSGYLPGKNWGQGSQAIGHGRLPDAPALCPGPELSPFFEEAVVLPHSIFVSVLFSFCPLIKRLLWIFTLVSSWRACVQSKGKLSVTLV